MLHEPNPEQERERAASGGEPSALTPRQRRVIERHEALAAMLAGPATTDRGDEEHPPWMGLPPLVEDMPAEAEQGEVVTLFGERLHGLSGATVGDIPAAVVWAAHREARIRVPHNAVGRVAVWVSGSHGQASAGVLRVTEAEAEAEVRAEMIEAEIEAQAERDARDDAGA